MEGYINGWPSGFTRELVRHYLKIGGRELLIALVGSIGVYREGCLQPCETLNMVEHTGLRSYPLRATSLPGALDGG